MGRFNNAMHRFMAGVTLIAGLNMATFAAAHDRQATGIVLDQSQIAGRIEWGVWIDVDGCMHWWADGGQEGYMLDRVNPKTGKPVCLKKTICLVEGTDRLFAADSAELTADGRRRLTSFFQGNKSFGYDIVGHTDSLAPDAVNEALSQDRASAVASVARSAGGMVEREVGAGEHYPIASNSTAAGMQKNRRIEVICYKW